MGKFIPVNYRLIDVHKSKTDGRIFVDGLRWADPSEKDFKKKIRKFREKSSIPTQWAKDLSKILTKSHAQTEINKMYDEVMKKEFGI